MLRVSDQFIEILGPGSGGTLRVTSQIIEVLAQPLSILEQSASNELEFSDDVIVVTPNQSLTQTIAFTQVAEWVAQIKIVSATNQLAFEAPVNYVGPLWLHFSTQLDLEDEARIPLVHELHLTEQVVFGETIAIHGRRHFQFTNSIDISQYGDIRIKVRTATNELTLTDTLIGEALKVVESSIVLGQDAVKGIHIESITNQIDFVQVERVNPITIGPGPRDRISLPAQNITFTQFIYNSVKSVHAENYIDIITDANTTRPWNTVADSEIQWLEDEVQDDGNVVSVLYGLQDFATVQKAFIQHLTSPVWLSQVGNKVRLKVGAIDLSASNELELETIIPEINYLAAENILELIDYVDNRHEFIETIIDFESEVSYNVNFAPRLLTSELELVSSFFGENDQFSLCDYSPFLGSTTDPNAPQRYLKNVPVIDPNRHGVTLFYPWNSPTTTVELRGPDLGNRNRLEFQRIKRETRGGTLIVWADPMWPKNEQLVLSFSGLIETEGQTLLDFIYLTLGQEIGLIDWEGNTWRVVTMTPSDPLVRNSQANLSINLEFEITRSILRGYNTNELLFIDTAVQQTIYNRNAEVPTWLIQALNYQAKVNKPVSQDIDFITSVAVTKILSQLQANDLEFNQDNIWQAIRNRLETTQLNLTQDPNPSIKDLIASSEFDIENDLNSISTLPVENQIYISYSGGMEHL